MATFFRILGAVVVILIAVLQFTKVFESFVGRCSVLGLAFLAVVCVVMSEVFTRREQKLLNCGRRNVKKIQMSRLPVYIHLLERQVQQQRLQQGQWKCKLKNPKATFKGLLSY